MNKKSLRGKSPDESAVESAKLPTRAATPRKSAAARLPKYPFAPVEAGREIISIDQAIEDFRRGRTLIVVDDENRENEGDFMFGASFATTERVNFLLRHAKGLICVASTMERLRELQLEKMVTSNTAKHGTNFPVTVDHRETSTGISAPDRALTIQAMADPMTQPDDLLRPGPYLPTRGRARRRAGARGPHRGIH